MQTVVQAGWVGVQNGELLRRAVAAGFEFLITMDRNLEHQQNIPRVGIGLLVLLARDNRVETVVPLAGPTLLALEQVHRGIVVHVGT